jgi:MerR family transcriptional regulator, mercuric resistance operon regulatory protein
MSGRRNESMQIGQISKQAGVGIDAVRFYERSGLLAAPARSDGGFRLYSLGHLSTLQFIRNLQALGFSLNEIREFLSLRSHNLRACSAVRKMLDHKLHDIHAKRIALAKLEAELKGALTKCNSETEGSTWKANRSLPSSHCV